MNYTFVLLWLVTKNVLICYKAACQTEGSKCLKSHQFRKGLVDGTLAWGVVSKHSSGGVYEHCIYLPARWELLQATRVFVVFIWHLLNANCLPWVLILQGHTGPHSVLFNVNVNHTGDFLFYVYFATVNLHCDKIKKICLLLQIINAHVLLHKECRRYSLWLNENLYRPLKTSTQNLACSQHHVNDTSLSGGNILWQVSYCCVQKIHFETGYWRISLYTEDVYFVMGYPQITVQKRYFVTSYWQIPLHTENVHFVIYHTEHTEGMYFVTGYWHITV